MSTTSADRQLPAVVLGGGLAGLAAARLLRRHFPRVVVLERDRRPETAEPEDAFASWERRGGPPVRPPPPLPARLPAVLLPPPPPRLPPPRAPRGGGVGLDQVTPPRAAP